MSKPKQTKIIVPLRGLGARWLSVVKRLKSLLGKVSEQLKLGLLPTIRAFWDKMKRQIIITTEYLHDTVYDAKARTKYWRWPIEHLNVHSFVGVRMGEGRRGIDERHDAQAVVHEGHVRNNDVHDGLWWREEEEEDGDYSFAVTKVYVIFIIFTLKSINTHRELNVPVSCDIIKDADMLIVLDYLLAY